MDGNQALVAVLVAYFSLLHFSAKLVQVDVPPPGMAANEKIGEEPTHQSSEPRSNNAIAVFNLPRYSSRNL